MLPSPPLPAAPRAGAGAGSNRAAKPPRGPSRNQKVQEEHQAQAKDGEEVRVVSRTWPLWRSLVSLASLPSALGRPRFGRFLGKA